MARAAADARVTCLIDGCVDTGFASRRRHQRDRKALRARQDKVRFVQVRHEESAAFTACGYAKFTARVGVLRSKTRRNAAHRHMVEALIRGMPDAGKIARQLARDTMRQLT